MRTATPPYGQACLGKAMARPGGFRTGSVQPWGCRSTTGPGRHQGHAALHYHVDKHRLPRPNIQPLSGGPCQAPGAARCRERRARHPSLPFLVIRGQLLPTLFSFAGGCGARCLGGPAAAASRHWPSNRLAPALPPRARRDPKGRCLGRPAGCGPPAKRHLAPRIARRLGAPVGASGLPVLLLLLLPLLAMLCSRDTRRCGSSRVRGPNSSRAPGGSAAS